MKNTMRRRIAFLLAFALIMVAAFTPHSASALDNPAPEESANPPAGTPAPLATPENKATPLPADPTGKPETKEDELGGNHTPGQVPPEGTTVPTLTEQPTATEEPTATEKPATTEEPKATEKPATTEEPKATEEPEEIEETAAVESENTEAATVSINGTVIWSGVPDGEVPSVSLSLRGGDGESRDHIKLIYGMNRTYAFRNLPTAGTDGVEYPAYRVVAAASRISGYTCKVTILKNTVTITYAEKVVDPLEEPPEENGDLEQDDKTLNENGTPAENDELAGEEPAPQLLRPMTNVDGSVNWVGVPEGATPGVTITLGGGDGESRDPITIAYGGETGFTFADLPTKDFENNDLPMYTVSADVEAIENYDCSAVADGLTVTVTYVPTVSEDTQAAVQAVIDAIDAYPSVETIGDMDPTREPYAAAVRDYHSIIEMINALPEDARALVTNLSVMEDATLKLYILGA